MIRVMLVEDEPPILRAMKKLIESCNPEFKVVASAADGEQAANILDSTPIDVVFTDIMMPVKDGFFVLEYINSKYPHIYSVVLSGHDEFDYAKKAIPLGIIDYLLKPVSKEELMSVVKKVDGLIRQLKRDTLKKEYDMDDRSSLNTGQLMSVIEVYLEENLKSSITHKSLSEKFGYSAPYISSLFKKTHGMTPAEYLTNLRVNKAKVIIETTPDVLTKNIASSTGFSDPFHFSKIFKKITGYTPRDYKNFYKDL